MDENAMRAAVREATTSMREYLEPEEMDDEEDFDPGYTLAEVDRCEAILLAYLSEVAASGDDAEILTLVRRAVLALNDLNEETDQQLIETAEREALALFIHDAAVAAGLTPVGDAADDVTLEWREW